MEHAPSDLGQQSQADRLVGSEVAQEEEPGASSGRRSRVTWDESNLLANEAIMAEFAHIRVPEPKTPYRPPLGPMDELEGDMGPLALHEGLEQEGGEQEGPAMEGPAHESLPPGGQAEHVPAPEDESGHRLEQGDGEGEPMHDESELSRRSSGQQQAAQRTVESAFDYVMSNGGANWSSMQRRGSAASGCSSDYEAGHSDGGSGDSRKKHRFEQARKQHYNMKEALQRSKQLLSEDEDDGGEAEMQSQQRRGPGNGAEVEGEAESQRANGLVNGRVSEMQEP